MTTFLLTIIIMLVLGVVSYVSSNRSSRSSYDQSALSLLASDIKYESPSGKFTFYFLITTSIVVSIILTLVLYFLR